ncbi:IS200/IS605 family transposase [Enterococcus faecalis]|uniref:IS200/IS605 family transposase n=1 Tax=Enterococcus faecalis TaxID=1351 RepID=UPI003F8EE99D
MSNDDKSLAHTRWNCKYHLVFTPKYRRKVIYGQLRRDIGKILRKLCEVKEVEIIEAHAMPNHIHMLVRIPPKLSVSGFMGFLKGRSAVIIHERHANLKYNYGNRSFGSKGYYVSTVGLNQKYIREQEAEDRVRDSINKREY